jgi:hypothetical protein
LKPKKDDKIRTYQNGEIVLDSKDFEALVDVFRTLLEWSNDLERTKNKELPAPAI